MVDGRIGHATTRPTAPSFVLSRALNIERFMASSSQRQHLAWVQCRFSALLDGVRKSISDVYTLEQRVHVRHGFVNRGMWDQLRALLCCHGSGWRDGQVSWQQGWGGVRHRVLRREMSQGLEICRRYILVAYTRFKIRLTTVHRPTVRDGSRMRTIQIPGDGCTALAIQNLRSGIQRPLALEVSKSQRLPRVPRTRFVRRLWT